jgi:3-dehydroquinate synthase
MGLSDNETLEMHYDTFNRMGLPTVVPSGFSLSDLWEKIRYDKHFLSDKAYMGLVRTAGVMAKPDNGHYGHFIDQEIIFAAIERNRRQAN